MLFNEVINSDHRTTLLINHRRYDLYDHGEGPCSLCFIDDLPLAYDVLAFPNRFIVIDTHPTWGKNIRNLPQSGYEKLAEDIHLIADIYWLDTVRIFNLSNYSLLHLLLKRKLQRRLML